MKDRAPKAPRWLTRLIEDGCSPFDCGHGVLIHIKIMGHDRWNEELLPTDVPTGCIAYATCQDCGSQSSVTVHEGDR